MTLEIKRRVLGPEPPEPLRNMLNLATSIQHQGRYADAEKLDRQTIEIRRRVLGPEHPDTALSMYNLAIVEELIGKRDEAVRLLGESVHHGLSAGNPLGIEKDPDLKYLRSDPLIVALVAATKQPSL